MIRKKKLLKLVILALIVFVTWSFYIMYVISNPQLENVRIFTQVVEKKIIEKFKTLPAKYKTKTLLNDPVSNEFVRNLHTHANYNIPETWSEADRWIGKKQFYDSNKNLGAAMTAMKQSKIVRADLNSKGTQLKFFLILEGDRRVVFKPKRYDRDEVIEGVVYAGKDRYGSEILGFYLSGLFDKPLVPVSVERRLDIRKEVLPVATNAFLKTTLTRNNQTCVYGVCYYCTSKDPVCPEENGYLYGAVIYYVNYKFKVYKNPWRRTYKKNSLALWETDENYCKGVLETTSKERVLDLVDVSVFDFLIQNGDRHHYEVYYDTLVWLDNGKGLGNPYVDHIDILAPLYQCCMIRRKTWLRLQELSGETLTENLKKMPDILNFMAYKHFEALERRLLLIYATVEYCIDERRLVVK